MHKRITAVFIFSATLGVTVALAQTPALLLFGAADHKTFLGCLNCSQFDGGSICNQFGPYGSEFSGTSIWNQFNSFGSQFSAYSPWNQFSSMGPVIVDKNGMFYGRLTANEFVSDRTRIEGLNHLTELVSGGLELETARKTFCGE